MKAYLLKLNTAKEIDTWNKFRKKCKKQDTELKQALLALIDSNPQENQINKRLQSIEETLTTIKLNTQKESFKTPKEPQNLSRIPVFTKKEILEKEEEPKAEKPENKIPIIKREKIERIHKLKEDLTLKDVCKLANVKFIRQGLSRFSEASIQKMLQALENKK